MLTLAIIVGPSAMPKGLIFLLVMIAFIIVYTIAKVVSYNRLSQKQWEQVDKSKLKEWDDDDSWD
jgi:ABC-type transport system involved in cytochrome bd biosynthesis fused ATPase/permease subunit